MRRCSPRLYPAGPPTRPAVPAVRRAHVLGQRRPRCNVGLDAVAVQGLKSWVRGGQLLGSCRREAAGRLWRGAWVSRRPPAGCTAVCAGCALISCGSVTGARHTHINRPGEASCAPAALPLAPPLPPASSQSRMAKALPAAPARGTSPRSVTMPSISLAGVLRRASMGGVGNEVEGKLNRKHSEDCLCMPGLLPLTLTLSPSCPAAPTSAPLTHRTRGSRRRSLPPHAAP